MNLQATARHAQAGTHVCCQGARTTLRLSPVVVGLDKHLPPTESRLAHDVRFVRRLVGWLLMTVPAEEMLDVLHLTLGCSHRGHEFYESRIVSVSRSTDAPIWPGTRLSS